MKINVISAKAYEKSTLPAIIFDVEVEYKDGEEVILDVTGLLRSEDETILARLERWPRPGDTTGEYDVATIKGKIDKTSSKSTKRRIPLVVFLGRKALNHIESCRKINRKKDAVFFLDFSLTILRTNAVISHLHIREPSELGLDKIGLEKIKVLTSKGEKEGSFVVYAYDQEFTPRATNGWILSGDNSPCFLKSFVYRDMKKYTIPASDWVNDFAPKLGLGEYFIVEVPKGTKAIKEAWDLLNEAKKCFLIWDPKGVFAHCREIGFLLDKLMSRTFGKQHYAYKEKWSRMLKKAFKDQASLDLHVQDIKKSHPDLRVFKHDVEYILLKTTLLIKYAEDLLKEKDLIESYRELENSKIRE
ncbi:MAG: hypothetical protein ACTSR0_06005 [Candidatus Asgardarchaeia archaeon]